MTWNRPYPFHQQQIRNGWQASTFSYNLGLERHFIPLMTTWESQLILAQNCQKEPSGRHLVSTGGKTTYVSLSFRWGKPRLHLEQIDHPAHRPVFSSDALNNLDRTTHPTLKATKIKDLQKRLRRIRIERRINAPADSSTLICNRWKRTVRKKSSNNLFTTKLHQLLTSERLATMGGPIRYTKDQKE
jgi:hypothetical protein